METYLGKLQLPFFHVEAGVPEPGLRGGVQVPMAKAFVGSNPTPRTIGLVGF